MTPVVVRDVESCRDAVAAARGRGSRIGFVPTMGALHEGHLSLVDRARRESEFVVVSIFVNPLQFGEREDLDRYPRDLEGDVARCAERAVDLVFAPMPEEMYPDPIVTRVTMAGPAVEFEGRARPGHFEGVLTVVAKLLHIVAPDMAVFGRKDAQQCAVIRRYVADLNVPVEIVVAPTVRDPDGVAQSSRNRFLSPSERESARALHQALRRAQAAVEFGERAPQRVEQAMLEVLDKQPIDVEYAAVVDAGAFVRPEAIGPGCLAIVAARVGTTRLIDNVELPLHA